jgi:hypothetical protein
MPTAQVVRSLYGEVVRSRSGAVRQTARFYDVEQASIALLTQMNPSFLIVTEFQHLLFWPAGRKLMLRWRAGKPSATRVGPSCISIADTECARHLLWFLLGTEPVTRGS